MAYIISLRSANDCSLTRRRGLYAARVLPVFINLNQDIQFYDLVTSARPRFQARSVEDRDLASDVADQVPLLEGACCIGDALAAHAQHVGEELLGQPEFV